MITGRVASWMLGSALAVFGHPPPVDALTVALAQDTITFVAPLAERAGLAAQRGQLEDASFRILDPVAYASLTVAHHADDLEHLRAHTERRLEEAQIPGIVTARLKSAYSTHRKMLRKDVPLEEITDRLAVRVRVPSVDACYRALALLESEFPRIPGSFDDYIQEPKPNGYQSLHTAVAVPGLGPVEFQVRTDAMHLAAEHGVAAHWRYKLAS